MDSVSETAWIACRSARVAVDTNDDASYTPREVIVVLHSAGMLVERRIPVPDEVQRRTFGDRETAAEAALAALELGGPRGGAAPPLQNVWPNTRYTKPVSSGLKPTSTRAIVASPSAKRTPPP